MIYLEKIKIIENTYPGSHILKTGFEIDFDSVNLFVGDQGCGKSTLLKLIQKNHSDIKLTLSDYTIKNGINSYYFDTENDNPRINKLERYSKPSGQSIGYGYGNAMVSRFKSHGEIIEGLIISPLEDAKDMVIILDEPESGLSLTNQFKLVKLIKKAIKNNCQFFIATHCYPLIKSFDVISLEHNEKMKGTHFINKIK